MSIDLCKLIFMDPQEGFASEVEASWLVRIYFMSFFIVMLVILQVVISFIVDEFKFKVLDTAKKRICPEHNEPFEHCRCKRCELSIGFEQCTIYMHMTLYTLDCMN